MPPPNITAGVNPRRRRNPQRQPRRVPVTVNPPPIDVQVEGWGSAAQPWPSMIDESDVSKEIISVWRQNVFAAENGGEVQKMEGLYDRLDKEREKWNEQLNNPLTWGWGGEPDELNDWARRSTNDAVREPDRWGERQQGHSDKTPDGVSRNPEPIPTSLERLLYSFAHKLKADGCQRSYAFVQLSSEAKVEKIREVAYQLLGSKKP